VLLACCCDVLSSMHVLFYFFSITFLLLVCSWLFVALRCVDWTCCDVVCVYFYCGQTIDSVSVDWLSFLSVFFACVLLACCCDVLSSMHVLFYFFSITFHLLVCSWLFVALRCVDWTCCDVVCVYFYCGQTIDSVSVDWLSFLSAFFACVLLACCCDVLSSMHVLFCFLSITFHLLVCFWLLVALRCVDWTCCRQRIHVSCGGARSRSILLWSFL